MSQVQNQTYFELFDLVVSFDIDLNDLNQRYRELQRTAHPDRFANASDRERRISVEKAALINEAYQTLKNPQKRARYMLELQSVSFDDEKDTILAPSFLMEQIELREELAEVSQNQNPQEKLNQIMLDIKNRISVVIDDLRQVMLIGELDETQKENARQLIHKMQFLNKLQQEAEYQEENILDAL